MSSRIYQFKITLIGISPTIWRRIQVPEDYSFWDLHVAIQDAMGWLDYHLHLFQVRRKHVPVPIEVGIPDDYAVEGDPEIHAGWEAPIADLFYQVGDTADEEHESMLEWLGGKFDPREFARGKIKFDNPTKRWKRAFS